MMEVDTESAGGEVECGESDLELRIMEALKFAEERSGPPLRCVMEVARCVEEKGLLLPDPGLGQVLVSNLCFKHNTSGFWKLLGQAIEFGLVCPLHVLALLTVRVVPHRRAQPEAYRLYLELLGRYALSSPSIEAGPCRDKITKSIDAALKLSHTYALDQIDYGHAFVLFIFCVLTSLIDSTLEDCDLRQTSIDKHSISLLTGIGNCMDTDAIGNLNQKTNERHKLLRRTNTSMAIEVVEQITSDRRAKHFLRLVFLNMPEKFKGLLQRLQHMKKIQKPVLDTLVPASRLHNIIMNINNTIDGKYQSSKRQLLGALADAAPCSLNSCNLYGVGKDACWIPFDVFMEDTMDGKHLYAVSAAEILTELTKTLQVINRATWQETFQALWLSALRLVQRDREPLEGPVPHLDARLCMLLSIVPVAITPIINEDKNTSFQLSNELSRIGIYSYEGKQFNSTMHGLVSCLQLLSQYPELLSPPLSVVNAANNAARKAANFVANFKPGNDNFPAIGRTDSSIQAVGNMLHLIVEACIARNLIDTSAYFWPGYVVPSALSRDPNLVQDSPWSTFLAGAPLTGALKSSLMNTPASSLTEVEKLHHLAVKGSEEEKSAAAKILCGASLVRGWNVQEHVVRIVVNLLSPPGPPNISTNGTGNYLIDHMPVLSVILFGVSCVDIAHILSLYGMVPEVAAALMPLCEVFGSLSPLSSHRSSVSEETSVYTVFSCAFLFLLRLWKFYKTPQEQSIAGRGVCVRMDLTLDYLLLMRNTRISLNDDSIGRNENNAEIHASTGQPVYIGSFPRLRAWYSQNQACIASTLSGLSNKNPVHQVANKILNMICRKMTKAWHITGNPSSNSSSSASDSPVNTAERPMLPAWELLEAVPFVLEALLTACAHGRLSSRDLTTGLRDLVDFLPASLAAIITYFSAEITRGIWKPVHMNGTDWPSPTATLLSVESEIKEILSSTGVHIQNSYPHGLSPMLPLPMAALVSLTITFKLDKSLEYIHGVVGQALENCATGCAWPSMPIIGALWTQKVRRWHDFIVLSCSRSPFTRDKDAVSQLIRSCFSSFLGPFVKGSSLTTAHRGVNLLLGQALSEKGARLPIKPGYLYLRTCRTFHDTSFVSGVVLKLVIEWAHKLANEWASSGSCRLKSSRMSLAAVACGVQQVATLGASLLYIAGGAQLVQVLYEETLPTFLLSARNEELGDAGTASHIMEGYAMAYMLILCAAFVWGVGNTSSSYASIFALRRTRVIGIHMDFIAGVMDGNIFLGCDPATWKSYVSCFICLLVNLAPAWIPEIKQETLRKLACGLWSWDEKDLAISLLELGGPAAMATVVEFIM